jgi:hypothetical protein
MLTLSEKIVVIEKQKDLLNETEKKNKKIINTLLTENEDLKHLIKKKLLYTIVELCGYIKKINPEEEEIIQNKVMKFIFEKGSKELTL